MAFAPFRFPPLIFCFIALLLIFPKVNGYESMFNFGDGFSDAGCYLIEDSDYSFGQLNIGKLPYCETYFNRSTGRFSNGRLIIDFMAEAFGLPFLLPYLAGLKAGDYKKGANFAVVGATAMDTSYFCDRTEVRTNSSLRGQLDLFKKLLPSLCSTETDCHEYLKRSLLVVGEIGERDYKFMGINSDVVRDVVNVITQTIMELITIGATNIMVPGMFPMGCLPYCHGNPASVRGSALGIDPQNGCLRDKNEQSEYHNSLLQYNIQLLRDVFPYVNIMYADNYNAAMRLFNNPTQYGFSSDVLRVCYGEDVADYNYDAGIGHCGEGGYVCERPELLVNWDGQYFTEAAYKSIASALIFENYTTPLLSQHNIRGRCSIPILNSLCF